MAPVLWSGYALAHAHLEESLPGDGARVTSAPPTLMLRFSESARLTALWIQRRGGGTQRITSTPEQARTRISVPLPRLEPGEYRVSWRVLGSDGHVVPGQIRFTLSR